MSLKTTSRFILTLGALAVLPLALSACGAAEEGYIADSEPPENQSEIAPVLADPSAEIWRPGYWSMGDDGSFVWVPGRVIARPAPTAVWSSAHWTRHTYGWSFEQGHWQ